MAPGLGRTWTTEPLELSELDLKRRAEYRRELEEQFKRKNKYKNGAEALQALRDLFESDEELEEFGRYIRRMRDEGSARYSD